MTKINLMGSYSGIDQNTIDQLMEAHRIPLNSLNNKKTNITEKQNAWKDINTRLNSLFDKLKTLESPSTFTSKTTTTTNDKIVTMSATTDAAIGNYDIYVKQLATSTRVVGGKVLEEGQKITDKLGKSGEFTITNAEGKSIKIEVGTEDSLKDIVKNINEATYEDGETEKSIGVKATIVDGRIVLTDEKTGARDIKVEGDAAGDLKLNIPEDEKMKGQQAEFTINGIEVKSNSNTVTDVLEGVTINLHKAHGEGESDTVKIGIDSEKATKAIKEFVDQYNSVMGFIEDKLKAGDPDVPGSKGILSGDSNLSRLHSTLRHLVTDILTDDKDSIKDISELGVSTKDKSGKLEFDSSKFIKALEENPNKVIDFFKGTEETGSYVGKINKEIDAYISTKKDENGRTGMIKSTMESFEQSIKDINKQIEVFNDRMEQKEQRYIKMFTALDVAMMQAESQLSWLQGQVDAMNGVKR